MRIALPDAFLTIPLAHRAYHNRAEARPENSPAAVRAAVAAGYGIEIDLHDGQGTTVCIDAAGVQVTVINGITAGLAAVTSLGVPLTHREHAHGVVFVTGHAKPGDTGTDWAALARTARDAKLTLVIYMGVSGAAAIEQELLRGGLPASTPVAVIQHASLPQQRHAIATLGTLHTTLVQEELGSPSVIVVGDVVRGVALASLDAAEQPLALRAG